MDKNIIEAFERYMNGKKESDFLKLCDEMSNPIKAFLKGMLCDQYAVDDVYNRALYDIYLSIDSFNPRKSAFMSWVRTIAKNNAINYIHSENIRKERGNTSLEAMVEMLPGDMDIDDIPEMIHEVIEEDRCVENRMIDASLECAEYVPDEYAGFVIDHYIRGKKVKEISIESGLPVSTLKNRIRKGRIMLLDEITERYPELCREYKSKYIRK